MEERFEKHKAFLVDRIDPDFGLLCKLRANGTLTREAVHKIKLKDNTTEDKNRILLDFILKTKKTNELMSALRDSGQIHLVNYINADGDYRFAFGDDWPLSESDISRLGINGESLVDLLDTSDLCNGLFSEEVINNRQKQLISSKPTDAEKNEALLDILTKCSLRQYKKTIDCLNNTNQSHLADLLSSGGVVVRVHANLEDAVGNRDEMEDSIISQLKKVLGNRPSDEAIRLLDLTKLDIIAVKKGQSIVIYIQCTTHDELLQLTDLLKTDRLKGIIEEVFTEMLSIGDDLRVKLTWSPEEFKTAATYFESLDSLDLPNDGTRHSKERKEKRSLKLPSVGNSDDVSLSGNLQSKLAVTERPSPSIALVDDSRHSDIKRWLSGQSSPRSIRTTRRSIYSGHSSGYVSHPSKLTKSKSLSSSTLSYNSEPIVLKSRGTVPEELPPLLNSECAEEHIISNDDNGSAITSTKENEQLIELQRERQRDKSKIEELERELSDEHRKSENLVEERRKLQEELEEQKQKFDELKVKLEMIQTERTATGISKPPSPQHPDGGKLENKVYYKDDPVLIKTISTKAAEENNKAISGLAIADNELFITNFHVNDVEVYDLKNLSLTRSWKVDPLINPWDLGYCNINKCLYIMDVAHSNTPKEIYRVDGNGKLLKRWTTNMDIGCISVTYDCNVVMASHQLIEYTADGQIVRQITLSAQAGFVYPRHAIKLPSGLYLISHGKDDSLHRVCVVDIAGDILMSFGGPNGSTSDRLCIPIYLAIDSNGSIFVVDCGNGRVVMLSSGLEFMRDIISSKKEGMHRPERMVLDQANGRLLVAHNDGFWSECQVFVFEML